MTPLLVHTTFEEEKDAMALATLLLKKRLIACAQIQGPITSFYWWDDKVEKSQEFRLSMKTKNELYNDLEKTINKNHPYEIPEIIATPITQVSVEYLQWMEKELLG